MTLALQEAGHYAFLDQPQDFLSHMLQICQPYLRSKVPQVSASAIHRYDRSADPLMLLLRALPLGTCTPSIRLIHYGDP